MSNAITVISAEFGSKLSAGMDQSGTPEGALAHVAGSEVDWEASGLPRRRRDVRSWVTFWPDEVAAYDFLSHKADAIPLIEGAQQITSWLLLPYASHGETNWIDGSPKPIPLRHAPKPPDEAPVFAITSIGLGGLGADALAFGQGIHAIRATIKNEDELGFEGQILPDDPKLDPVTLSHWQSEAAMIRFAYRQDPHKGMMSSMNLDGHRGTRRASFTRCQVRAFFTGRFT